MAGLSHGQVWTRTADSIQHVVLRPAVQMILNDGTTQPGVLFMAKTDVDNGVPGAQLYCLAESLFHTQFTPDPQVPQ